MIFIDLYISRLNTRPVRLIGSEALLQQGFFAVGAATRHKKHNRQTISYAKINFFSLMFRGLNVSSVFFGTGICIENNYRMSFLY